MKDGQKREKGGCNRIQMSKMNSTTNNCNERNRGIPKYLSKRASEYFDKFYFIAHLSINDK